MSKEKDKGTRVENEIAKLLTEKGVPSRRVAGSGALEVVDARLRGDVQVGVYANDDWLLTGECKARKTSQGFKTILDWLEGNDALFVRVDGKKEPAFVALPFDVFVALAQYMWQDENETIERNLAEMEKARQMPKCVLTMGAKCQSERHCLMHRKCMYNK